MQLIKKITVFACLFTFLIMPAFVLAQASDIEPYFGEGGTFKTGVSEKLPTEADVPATIARIINVILGFLGIVAVIIILIGGFMWMTAGGNEEKVGKAKKLLVGGIIGLAIILSAYAIASYVIGQIKGAVVG